MAIAIVDSDPPLPPAYPHTPPFTKDNPCEEVESKHTDASFLLLPQKPWYRSYTPNTVAPSNGRRSTNHDLMTMPGHR